MCTAEVIHLLTTKFLRGDQTDVGSVAGVRRLKRALELLASNVMLECGELLMATGVLWTPNETGEVLTRSDMPLDCPLPRAHRHVITERQTEQKTTIAPGVCFD